MDDFEKYLEEKRREEEEERQTFMDKCASKIRDGDLIYHLLGLGLCERFNLKLNWNGEPPYVVWGIVNYYVENIDMDWVEWLKSDDAPIIRPISQLKRIFPEFASITSDDEKIIKMANRIYGLDIRTDYDICYGYSKYFFAYSFNFNNFKPLPIKEIKIIKDEKEVLIKHGYDTSELDKKLSNYGLTKDELDAI